MCTHAAASTPSRLPTHPAADEVGMVGLPTVAAAAAVAVVGSATDAEMRRKGWPGIRRKEAQSSHSFFHPPGGGWGSSVVFGG